MNISYRAFEVAIKWEIRHTGHHATNNFFDISCIDLSIPTHRCIHIFLKAIEPKLKAIKCAELNYEMFTGISWRHLFRHDIWHVSLTTRQFLWHGLLSKLNFTLLNLTIAKSFFCLNANNRDLERGRERVRDLTARFQRKY